MTKTKNNLQEISAEELIRKGNMVQNNNVGDVSSDDIKDIHWAYEAGTKRLSCWGKYQGQIHHNEKVPPVYPFIISFLRVDSQEINSPEEFEQITGVNAKELDPENIQANEPIPVFKNGRVVYYLFATDYDKVFIFKPFDEDSSDIQVRCGCPSYRFSYYAGNSREKGATGAKFPHYTPKGTGTPKPVSVGMCKHLQNLINVFKNNGLIQ